jgi:hypothetical protein
VVATLVVEFIGRRSLSLAELGRAGAALVLGFALVTGPYLAVVGAWTPAAAMERLIGRRGPGDMVPFNATAADAARVAMVSTKPDWRLPDGQPMVFGRKDFSSSTRFHGSSGAAFEFVRELAQSLHYVLGLLALYGLWAARRRMYRPIDRLLIIFCGLYSAAAFCVAWQSGYLSGRHLLPLVAIALPWAAVGIWEFAAVACAAGRAPRAVPLVGSAIVALLVIGCLCSTLKPLGAGRAGHRQAIDWLASPQARAGAVLDSMGLTALYSGRTTYRYHAAAAALADPKLAYIVIEQSELAANSGRGATLRAMLARWGERAAAFAPADGKSKERTVLVYDWQGEPFAQYLGENHAP